jgi:transposase
VIYAAPVEVCCHCPLKSQCTSTTRRFVQRHLHDGALQRMNARATAQAMRLRRCTVERPFAMLKYAIFGHPRFLLRGLAGAQAEITLASIAYNLKTMINFLGASNLAAALS